MQIVTGRRGEPHVTSRQMQAVYRSFLGDFALLDVGNHLAATATSNDNVRISDGVVAVQGIYAVIAYNEYDDNYIEPVSVGMKRIDTLILHYTKSNDIEDMQIEVVEGEEVVDNPVAPTIAEGGDAWEGTADIKVPIYDVLVTSFGLTVTPYSRMNTLIPTLDSIAERIPETVVTGVKGDSESLYRNGNVNITKANIGLGNVDNTADTDKPVSTATQTALNLKADLIYVNAVVASAYHAGGNLTVAELTSSLLIADNMGKVYNMSDSGVTTADFVEGAGKPIREGDDIGICNRGTVDNPIYKFNLLSGFVDLSAYATTSAVNAGLAEKVDKVAGKGLSTEDYTDAEKQKLANIESNAQANVQSDWNEDDTEDDGYIKNKPNLSTSQTATGNPLTIESSESNLVECVAEVEAVQDLHGYDNPWVGGAGKNKLPMTVDGIKSANTSGTWSGNVYTINGGTVEILTDLDNNVIGFKVNGTFNATVWFVTAPTFTLDANTYIISGAFNNVALYGEGSTAFADWNSTKTTPETQKTFTSDATGRIYLRALATQYSNEIVYPMIRLSTETDATFEPYENKSSITGQTEVVITDNGINQWDEQWEVGDIDNNGQNTSSSTDMRSKNYVKVFPNTAYYYKQNSSHTTRWFKVFYYDKNKTFISKSEQQGSTERTTPSNCYYVRFAIYGTFEDNNISINYPSTDTDYHAYKGKTYTIQLGDTIYGGELDVLTGKLRVTHGEVDLGDLNWIYVSGIFYANVERGTVFISNAICSAYENAGTGVNPANGQFGYGATYIQAGYRAIRINDTRYTDASAFKTAVTGQTLVYELAEPYTIQLTPQQIRLLKGTNHLSCNTGDLSIKYYPDNVLGQLKGDIEKGLNAYYDYQIQALWDKINELQA